MSEVAAMFSCRVVLPVVLLFCSATCSQALAATSVPAASATTGPPLASLQAQAATGDAEAEYALGQRLGSSTNPADKSKAVAWYRKAAAQGSTDAEWALGLVYAVGDSMAGVQKDVPTGLKWMRKSLFDGSADHMGIYGYILAVSSFHAGNKQGVQDGVKWILRGAKGGSAQSMNVLGNLLLTGLMGVPRDKAGAEHWLLEAAKMGNAKAQESLGVAYVAGGLGSHNVKAGLHWLRESAEQGNITAEGTLSMLLITGKLQKIQIPKDPEEGVQWANKAAAKYNAVGFYALGNAYQYGEGEPRDPAKAWYNFAVAKRLDTRDQLEHVDQHLSEVSAKLSAVQLRQLKAEVAKIPVPEKNSKDGFKANRN